jgi:hypothetical protein
MELIDLDLSVRSYNCLKRAGIDTLEDIIQRTEEDMIKIRNLGRKNLEEIEWKLHEFGLGLKNKTPRKMTGREKLFKKLTACSNKDLAETLVGSAICPEIVNKRLCEEGFCIQCLTEDFEKEYD